MTTNDPLRITNRTRSLLIGIDYKDTPFELDGCINDVNTMIHVLKSVYFPLREVCTLVEDPSVRGRPAPTRENILTGMKWLVREAQAGDTLLMYYTGHGSQASAGEDGFNETIVPVDYQQSGIIVDDDMYNILVSALPPGVRLTIVMDCCHGGTLLDFPYSFEASLQNTSNSRGKMNTSRRRFNPSRHLADVVMFSGSLDYRHNNSIDTKIKEKGDVGGSVFTNAFAHVITHSLTASRPFMMLLVEMREILQRKGLNQLPHLAATKPIDMARPFSFSGTLPAFGSYPLHTLHQSPPPTASTSTTMSKSSTPLPNKHVDTTTTTTTLVPTKPQYDHQLPQQQAAHSGVGVDASSARSYQAARRRQTSHDHNNPGASQ